MFYTAAFVCISLIVTQLPGGLTNPDAMEPQPTARLIKLLDDVTEFFEDILDSISTLFDFGQKPNKKSSWGIASVFKYTKSTVKSIYRIVKDALPVVRIARQSLRSLYPVLPNTTIATFVEHLLYHLTPELMLKI